MCFLKILSMIVLISPPVNLEGHDIGHHRYVINSTIGGIMPNLLRLVKDKLGFLRISQVVALPIICRIDLMTDTVLCPMVNQHIFIGTSLRQKIQLPSDIILAGARGHVLLP
jgi:hypothetical protein